jgi:hypothetical protein
LRRQAGRVRQQLEFGAGVVGVDVLVGLVVAIHARPSAAALSTASNAASAPPMTSGATASARTEHRAGDGRRPT